jgi:hypothetical protein
VKAIEALSWVWECQASNETYTATVETIEALARPSNVDIQPELIARYTLVRRFLPTLLRTISFQGTAAGRPVLNALAFLHSIEGQRDPDLRQAPREVVPRPWRRFVFLPRRELRHSYREGQEDQLGALGLVLNVLVLWNTWYLDQALRHLRSSGVAVDDADVARLWPLGSAHFNMVGRYTFVVPEMIQQGAFRPLTVATDHDEPAA